MITWKKPINYIALCYFLFSSINLIVPQSVNSNHYDY